MFFFTDMQQSYGLIRYSMKIPEEMDAIVRFSDTSTVNWEIFMRILFWRIALK